MLLGQALRGASDEGASGSRPLVSGDKVSARKGIDIVATEDNTTVTITPSPTADLENGQTSPYTETMQRGEIYQIRGNQRFVADVTGTFISSDKPIGIFAGAGEAYVPYAPYDNFNNHYLAADPLMQEQLPIEQWGTNVVAIPFALRQKEIPIGSLRQLTIR